MARCCGGALFKVEFMAMMASSTAVVEKLHFAPLLGPMAGAPHMPLPMATLAPPASTRMGVTADQKPLAFNLNMPGASDMRLPCLPVMGGAAAAPQWPYQALLPSPHVMPALGPRFALGSCLAPPPLWFGVPSSPNSNNCFQPGLIALPTKPAVASEPSPKSEQPLSSNNKGLNPTALAKLPRYDTSSTDSHSDKSDSRSEGGLDSPKFRIVRTGRWSAAEHEAFLAAYAQHKSLPRKWEAISRSVGTRDPAQVRSHGEFESRKVVTLHRHVTA